MMGSESQTSSGITAAGFPVNTLSAKASTWYMGNSFVSTWLVLFCHYFLRYAHNIFCTWFAEVVAIAAIGRAMGPGT
jgi:hypothetical protein